MLPVIIESPYAGDIERNTLYARRALAASLSMGEAPFASHLLYTQPGVLQEDVPAERELGIRAGYAWMEHAMYVVLYVDYGISPGMQRAVQAAEALKLPVLTRLIGPNP